MTILLLLGLLVGTANLRGAAPQAGASNPNSLQGTLRGATGDVLAGAVVELDRIDERGRPNGPGITADTDANGHFNFAGLSPGSYRIEVHWAGNTTASRVLSVAPGNQAIGLHLIARKQRFLLRIQAAGTINSGPRGIATGNVGSQQVSNLPLEQRDSSKLLLLAAGTTTTNGSGGNFTQQYSIHGQRGTTAVFALDGADTTDPELGGATISDFNVDAIQSIDSVSGVMPASVGEGAAGYTNIISKSGENQLHGVAFEFLRNSALDARNYFDLGTPANPGRIPPFIRNEFGVTNGGPVFLPHLYDGRDRTFYFVEYQGLRQIQGTTQVLSVPTQSERMGRDTTAFPGDTLYVPVNLQIQPALNIYPLPNAPTGAFGPNTYATNSKVDTSSDQFSIRIDHRISEKAQLTGRFTYENTVGPITNPDQTAIDPSYAQLFTQGYRGLGINYTRISSPTLAMTTTIGLVRSTPLYNSINQTQPGLTFGNKLFEGINSESGGARGTWGNLYQLRQTFTKVHGSHAIAGGGEARVNRDTTEFSFAVNGGYSFGSGPAYSPVAIPSASGQRNINVGDLLPDALTGFLTGTPYSFTKTAGGRGFPQGDRIGEAGVRRASFDFYILDNWKAARRVSIN
ncbi:MAG: carboxypeptidase regulatory-like domain-containing protein, partial [Candidatus Acidiferrales bacterium]